MPSLLFFQESKTDETLQNLLEQHYLTPQDSTRRVQSREKIKAHLDTMKLSGARRLEIESELQDHDLDDEDYPNYR